MLGRDVVDELHDDDGLADAGAAEQPDLAATQVWFEQIDDLDPGLEHLQLGRLLLQPGRLAVDGPTFRPFHRPIREIHGLAQDVEHPAQRVWPDRHGDLPAEVDGQHAALHAVGWLHANGPHPVFAQVLLDLSLSLQMSA